MKDLSRIAKEVQDLEDQIKPLRDKAASKRQHIENQVHTLLKVAATVQDDQKLRLADELEALGVRIQEAGNDASLDEIEAEVSRIHANLDLEGTTYFSASKLREVTASQKTTEAPDVCRHYLKTLTASSQLTWQKEGGEVATQELQQGLLALASNRIALEVVTEKGLTLASEIQGLYDKTSSEVEGSFDWDQMQQVVSHLDRLRDQIPQSLLSKEASSLKSLKVLHNIIGQLERTSSDDRKRLLTLAKELKALYREVRRHDDDVAQEILNSAKALELETYFLSEVVEDLSNAAIMWELKSSSKAASTESSEDLNLRHFNASAVYEDLVEAVDLDGMDKEASMPDLEDMSFEEVSQYIDTLYGDQSLNETYYFSRKKEAFEEMVDEIEGLYGPDQSLNETYYPSRKESGKEASWQDEEQFYLMDDDFEDSKKQVHAEGYFGENWTDKWQNPAPHMPVQTPAQPIMTPGYESDEVIEMPEVQESYPQKLSYDFEEGFEVFAGEEEE